ncbi:uncharacterized protein LOC134932298 [Pseudophryne corroboree]|uniref:uncharacterized protein LOC134932298 n=1 Tax=Pseudophryne corroboree TaxID=495146 RepID=UPI0030815DD2
MMKNLLILGATFLVASAVNDLDEEWNIWKSNYGKQYSNKKEDSSRRQIWEANWQKVQKHNRLAEQGLKNYTLGMNHFADKTVQELMPQKSLCYARQQETKTEMTPEPALAASCETTKKNKFPKQVDWRESGCVTPVKNSGLLCESRWAFATVSVLESRYCIKSKRLLTLSEQQLIDCDDNNSGCCGGNFNEAFEYVSHNGIMENKDYEYVQSQSQCFYKPKKAIKLNVNKYYKLSEEKENIAKSVATDGPVAVKFDTSPEFFLYNGGIYDEECSYHGDFQMAVVGYGSSCGTDYWILKNSWGKEWGEDGYARIITQCITQGSVAAVDIAESA